MAFVKFMRNKFFHPHTYENQKRTWIAEQKHESEKKAQEDLHKQYLKEQAIYENKNLLKHGKLTGEDKLSFMYEPPLQCRKKDEKLELREVRFEWQKNAPRAGEYAKNLDVADRPFGIEVRNTKCIKCGVWGHMNTDKICPLYNRGMNTEDNPPDLGKEDPMSLLNSMEQGGLKMRKHAVNSVMDVHDDKYKMLEDEKLDPEVAFIANLSDKQKRKLMKKLNRSGPGAGGGGKAKHKKKKHKKEKKAKHEKTTQEDTVVTEVEPIPEEREHRSQNMTSETLPNRRMSPPRRERLPSSSPQRAPRRDDRDQIQRRSRSPAFGYGHGRGKNLARTRSPRREQQGRSPPRRERFDSTSPKRAPRRESREKMSRRSRSPAEERNLTRQRSPRREQQERSRRRSRSRGREMDIKRRSKSPQPSSSKLDRDHRTGNSHRRDSRNKQRHDLPDYSDQESKVKVQLRRKSSESKNVKRHDSSVSKNKKSDKLEVRRQRHDTESSDSDSNRKKVTKRRSRRSPSESPPPPVHRSKGKEKKRQVTPPSDSSSDSEPEKVNKKADRHESSSDSEPVKSSRKTIRHDSSSVSESASEKNSKSKSSHAKKSSKEKISRNKRSKRKRKQSSSSSSSSG